MTTRNELDQSISAWLEADAPHRAPDDVLEASRDRIRNTRQRRSWWPARRSSDMNNFAKVLVATAAVMAIAVVGINLLPGSQTGAGGPPSPSPTPVATPTASPTPSATPKSDQLDGDLQPGTYTGQSQLVPSLDVTFTVPGGWTAYGDAGALLGLMGAGNAIQFRDVTTLKGDPCHWSGPDNDIRVGPTADDLVQALQEQTAYEASDPVDVEIGGYAGQRVDIVSPTEAFAEVNGATTAVGCDEGVWRFWDGEIYAQGPANRWQTNVLDVDGTRFVIVVQDFPDTSAADRAELDAVVDSMVIEP